MKITQQEVAKVAVLARLDLSTAELEVVTRQMDAVLGYVGKLNELDTDGILPTAHAVPMSNAFRADEVRPSLAAEAALSNAPDRRDDTFRVPKVIE